MPTSTDLTNGLERVRYFSRQLITADDMRTEQEYFLQKLRRHNRMLHGAGVVCGLEVSSSPDTGAPLRVAVTGGYALSPQGDEICITKTSYIDLATGGAASGDPCLPATTSSVVTTGGGQRSDVFVGVRYDECPSRPVRVTPPGCGCGDSTCDYSRTRDGWKLGCWPVPSNWTAPAKPTTCADAISALLTCPPGSSDVWVILARVTFDATDSSKLGSIDNTVRQWLLSTAVLQGVCCAASSGGATPTPPEGTGKVQSVAVTPSTKQIKVGTTVRLVATVTADSGVAKTVSWSSANAAVGTVSSSGVVTGVSRGTVVITARSTVDNSVVGTATVKVS